MTDTQAQEAAMPVIAYLRASKDGMPQWTEDCVCEDPVYPSDPDGSDEDCISMPMVRKADADAVIASQAALIAELESRVHTCGPTCSKAGCINRRLAAEVEALRAELDAHRLYARQLCKAIDAATDFAGTVAGGASWWDDVWAEHHSALDRAREGISAAIDQLKDQK